MSSLLKIKDLNVIYPLKQRTLLRSKTGKTAIKNVSFELEEGETLGIVGESGCGKTTLAKAVMNILKFNNPYVRVEGHIEYSQSLNQRQDIQMIFQDPYSALNPRHTLRTIIEEPLLYNTKYSKAERELKISEIMEKVGLSSAKLNSFPHEFSGGQRQRIGIARALITNPKIIIADEPVSALDVSIQAQILNLINDIKREFTLSMIFIAHNLPVVEYISDRVLIMYNGEIVESGNTSDIIKNPSHRYTKELISSVPEYIAVNSG